MNRLIIIATLGMIGLLAGCEMEDFAPGYESGPDAEELRLAPPRYAGYESELLAYFLPTVVPGYTLIETSTEPLDEGIFSARAAFRKQLSTRVIELSIIDSGNDLTFVYRSAHKNPDETYESTKTNLAGNPAVQSTEILKPLEMKHDIGIGSIKTISVRATERIFFVARGDDTPFAELYDLLRTIDESIYKSELMRLRVECRVEGTREAEMAPGRHRLEVAKTCIPGDHVEEMVETFERRAKILCPNGYRGGYEKSIAAYATFQEFVCDDPACQDYPLVTGVISCR